jgi:uncharacterized protein YpmB
MVIAIIILVLVVLIIFGIAMAIRNWNAPAVEAQDTEQDKIKHETKAERLDFRRDRWNKRKPTDKK